MSTLSVMLLMSDKAVNEFLQVCIFPRGMRPTFTKYTLSILCRLHVTQNVIEVKIYTLVEVQV